MAPTFRVRLCDSPTTVSLDLPCGKPADLDNRIWGLFRPSQPSPELYCVMSDTFDPYVQWLGIRDPQRPPNHYRLLGVDIFEGDPEVLTNAADRQMAHVRNFQGGKRSALSQKLLNELASAKICLLNSQKRVEYDIRLRAELNTSTLAGTIFPVPTAASPAKDAISPSPPHAQPTAPARYAISQAPDKRDVFPSVEEWPQQDLAAEYPVAPGDGGTFWASAAIGVLLALAAVLIGLIVFVSQRGRPREQLSLTPVTIVQPAEPAPELSAEIPAKPRPGPHLGKSDKTGRETPPPSTQPNLPGVRTPGVALPASLRPTPKSLPASSPQPSRSKPAPPAIQSAANPQPPTTAQPATQMSTSPSGGGKPSPQPTTPLAVTTSSSPALVARIATPSTKPVAPGTAPQPPQEKPAEAIVRLPVPEKEALAKARQDIRHIFSKEFGAADQAEQKSKLAGMLLKQALDTKDDATARYGLFCEARDEALEAADLGRYTKIVKKTAEHYQIDALAIRAGGLRQATKRPHPSSSVTLTLTRLLMQLAEEMTADDRYDEADAMAKLAHELATRYKNYPRAKEAAALRRDVEQVRQFHKAAEDAEKALAQHPDDPAANLLLGKYYCFGRQQWERGLPMLAKGNQETLKALAVAEKTTPANATEMVALGDRWWDAAGSGRVADMQRFVQARAAYWYRLALPDLLGLTMIRIQQRLDEIGR